MNDQASTVRKVSGITSAAEKKAPSAMWIAGVPLKYRWCIVPTTQPMEYSTISRYTTRVSVCGETTPSSTKMYATMIVVKSSRKSSTHRCTTQKRQKSATAKSAREWLNNPTA